MLRIEIKELEPDLFAVIEHEPEPGLAAGVQFADGPDDILEIVREILESRSPTPPPAELSDKA